VSSIFDLCKMKVIIKKWNKVQNVHTHRKEVVTRSRKSSVTRIIQVAKKMTECVTNFMFRQTVLAYAV